MENFMAVLIQEASKQPRGVMKHRPYDRKQKRYYISATWLGHQGVKVREGRQLFRRKQTYPGTHRSARRL